MFSSEASVELAISDKPASALFSNGSSPSKVYELVPEWRPAIYTCEISDVKPKLEAFYSKGFSFADVSKMMAKNLDDLHKSAFSVWIQQTLEIFKGSIGIADDVYRECHESWSMIRLALFPHAKRRTS